MPTFDETHALHERSLLARWRRDLRVMGQLARMLWVWFRVARKIRAAYRAKEAKGEIYWLDEIARGYEGRR